ncbi:hypothetical protein P4O66_022719 [Electrophorus voltai]|uniref:LRAT domain-containing protein n=1 Tax=Electrophorus voltai TaxID=2609070 RepID=A0AAD8ZNR0_9TELE|nr:hypothetical protein P4O66_022719 [Electrophorus voltai]
MWSNSFPKPDLHDVQVAELSNTAQFGDLIEFSYAIGYSHWGVYNEYGYIIHFAVADESQLMSMVRGDLQTIFPLCGDLLLGETKIRRQQLLDVNVPKGAQIPWKPKNKKCEEATKVFANIVSQCSSQSETMVE